MRTVVTSPTGQPAVHADVFRWESHKTGQRSICVCVCVCVAWHSNKGEGTRPCVALVAVIWTSRDVATRSQGVCGWICAWVCLGCRSSARGRCPVGFIPSGGWVFMYLLASGTAHTSPSFFLNMGTIIASEIAFLSLEGDPCQYAAGSYVPSEKFVRHGGKRGRMDSVRWFRSTASSTPPRPTLNSSNIHLYTHTYRERDFFPSAGKPFLQQMMRTYYTPIRGPNPG